MAAVAAAIQATNQVNGGGPNANTGGKTSQPQSNQLGSPTTQQSTPLVGNDLIS